MKTLIACALMTASGTVQAGTTTLSPESCTATQICFTPTNSAGWEIDYISDATQYGRLVISINGDIYDSGLHAYPNLSAFTLYDGSGNPLSGSLSITITTATKCVQQGRTCVYPKTVVLNGGTLNTTIETVATVTE